MSSERVGTGRSGEGTPVRRRSIVDLAVEALRDKILKGECPEGSPLRQDALAADLGVSRIPVREALRQLEVEGLVTFSPYYGAVVSVLSLEEIDELFELRALIEGDLLRSAVPALTPEILGKAEEVLEAYEAAFHRADIAAWGQLNWEFHSTLLAGAGRPLTLGVLATLHNQSDRYMRMQLALTHGESRASEEHHAILGAVRGGDVDRAVSLVRDHILSAGRSLIDFLRVQRAERAKSSTARKG